MVAIQTAAGMAIAIATHQAAPRLPTLGSGAQDSAAKAAIGLGLIVASAKVGNSWAKTAMIGAGTGLITAEVGEYVPFLS